MKPKLLLDCIGFIYANSLAFTSSFSRFAMKREGEKIWRDFLSQFVFFPSFFLCRSSQLAGGSKNHHSSRVISQVQPLVYFSSSSPRKILFYGKQIRFSRFACEWINSTSYFSFFFYATIFHTCQCPEYVSISKLFISLFHYHYSSGIAISNRANYSAWNFSLPEVRPCLRARDSFDIGVLVVKKKFLFTTLLLAPSISIHVTYAPPPALKKILCCRLKFRKMRSGSSSFFQESFSFSFLLRATFFNLVSLNYQLQNFPRHTNRK